jgi:amino acid permease
MDVVPPQELAAVSGGAPGMDRVQSRHRLLRQPGAHVSHGIFSASTVLFFSYIGLNAVSTMAEETKNPDHDIPILHRQAQAWMRIRPSPPSGSPRPASRFCKM